MTDDTARIRAFNLVWGNWPGWGQLAAVNHSSIGRRFVVTGMLFFLVGGLMAMLMRTQLALPEQTIVDPEQYAQLFTLHGTVMMFLFAIPVLEGFAVYLIPKMIGARDLVFPRVSAFGYYCYLFGGLIILGAFAAGIAPSSGWFMYTPLSDATFSPGRGADVWLIGITFVEVSALAAGIELVVTILRARASGMSLRRMPIFCWYILGMAFMIVFGFPPLILASILLELERAAGFVFFSVAGGGDPLLWQHLFWLFGHPEVYIIFLPAAGMVSALIPVFAQRPIVGYGWLVLSVILIGFISFGLWVHHMFTVGIPPLAQAFFSIASMLIAIPTGIQIFSWVATLWTGRVRRGLPMLWLFGFLVIFVCGGLTGVMLALVPFNWQVHDTHFVVAHLHYVLVGGMLFPLIAGFYYWLPHFSGRMPSDRLGRWGFWLTFGGFNGAFLLMHLTGLLGMPRRIYTYTEGLGWDGLNLLSSVAGFVMAIGLVLVLLDLVLHARVGTPAARNPWQADTLEWLTDTPPAPYNFIDPPAVDSRHPLWQAEPPAAGPARLGRIDHGRRETLGSDALHGRPREIFHLASNSWLPLQNALLMALLCAGLLTRVYPLALAAAVVTLFWLLRWSWVNGAHPAMAPLTADEDDRLRLHSRGVDGPGRWGMVVTLMADGAFYASLLFGWFYLWTAAPQWPVGDGSPLPLMPLLLSGLALTMGTAGFQRLARRLREGRDHGLQAALAWCTAWAMLHAGLLVAVLWVAPLSPTRSAHDAVLVVLLAYLLLHGGLAAVLTGLQALRARRGYVGARLPYEPQVLLPWWRYSLGVYWLGIAAFVLLPMGWSGA